MADQPKAEDVRRMGEVQQHVVRAIASYRENTEAAIVAGALLRIVRYLYSLYPERTRNELLEGAIAFLQQRDIEKEIKRADLGHIITKGIM